MKNVIYLKDNKETAYNLALSINSKETSPEHRYKHEHILKAVELLSKANLRYDIKKGITYLKREWIEKSESVSSYDNISEVIEWQFVYEILNSASRLERGLKAI